MKCKDSKLFIYELGNMNLNKFRYLKYFILVCLCVIWYDIC